MRIFFTILLFIFVSGSAFAEIDLSPYQFFSELNSEQFDYTLSEMQSPVSLLGDTPVLFNKTVSGTVIKDDPFKMNLFAIENFGDFIMGNDDENIAVKKQPNIAEVYNNTHCDETASEFEKYFSKPLKLLEFNLRLF